MRRVRYREEEQQGRAAKLPKISDPALISAPCLADLISPPASPKSPSPSPNSQEPERDLVTPDILIEFLDEDEDEVESAVDPEDIEIGNIEDLEEFGEVENLFKVISIESVTPDQ